MGRDEWVDRVARWAETYGDPEEWAQKAKAAHARAEEAEARVRALENALEGAQDFVERVERWSGGSPEEPQEIYDSIERALASEGTPEEASDV